MAATQADIDKLVTAIATGEKVVKFADGSSVEYRTVMEMERALSILQGRVATVPMMRTTLTHFVRG